MPASTTLFRNAVVLADGMDLSAQLNECAVQFGAEMLDRTTMGDTTRNRRGGLFTVSITLKGFTAYSSGGFESVLFADVGIADVPFVLFRDGVTEGTADGVATLGTVETFVFGGQVGTLLPLEMSVQGSGLSLQ